MAVQDTKQLIGRAAERFLDGVPALRKLRLVARLELRARGEPQVWRVEVPGPKVDRDPAADARLDISVSRPHFNELAEEGRLQDWVEAYEHGHVKVTGDSAVMKLLANVIERKLQRERV